MIQESAEELPVKKPKLVAEEEVKAAVIIEETNDQLTYGEQGMMLFLKYALWLFCNIQGDQDKSSLIEILKVAR